MKPPAANQADTMLELRDIHLPDAVSWWPPAAGWWIITAVLIIVALAVFLLRKIKQRRQLQRAALAELDSIRARFEQNYDAYALVQSLSILLRRTSISFYPRADTAGLTGEAWLAFLDETSEQADFKNHNGSLLASAPYLPKNKRLDIDAEELISLCENWIRAQPVKATHTTGTPA